MRLETARGAALIGHSYILLLSPSDTAGASNASLAMFCCSPFFVRLATWIANWFLVSPRVRVREGPTAQEVKEEPEDPLRPRASEVGMVEMLRKHGVSTPDAVYSLRKSGNRFEVALQCAMDIANTREESRQLDRARLESEKEKDRAAALERVKDKTLMVLGEVISHFPQVQRQLT